MQNHVRKGRQRLNGNSQPATPADRVRGFGPLRHSWRRNNDETASEDAPSTTKPPAKAAENPAKPTNNDALHNANEARARKAATEPAVIVFGYNEHRIPQAAWFSVAQADLVTRAARLMGLRVLRIERTMRIANWRHGCARARSMPLIGPSPRRPARAFRRALRAGRTGCSSFAC